MREDFKKRKKIYEDLIDCHLLGSDENYSITVDLPNFVYQDEVIPMSSYLNSWKKYLKKREGSLSMYIHIPFCVEKCHYCFSHSRKLKKSNEIDVYLEKLLAYIDFFEDLFKGYTFDSFYMGGGNPGFLNPDQINRLLGAVFSKYSFKKDGERTVENDPRTTSKEKMETFKSNGINRFSMGVQSTSQQVLELNNRLRQKKERVKEAADSAREVGFNIFNMDLMIGLYGDDIDSILSSFKDVIEMNPDEISFYPLQPVKSYLQKTYDVERQVFFKNRRELYKRLIPRISKIAKDNNYFLQKISDFSEDLNDADCIKVLKKDIETKNKNINSSYVANPVFSQGSILGLGTGSGSFIFRQLKCSANKQLTKKPENYCFYGRFTDSYSELVKHVITNISNRSRIDLPASKEFFKDDQIKKIKEIFLELEKEGVVQVDGSTVYFKFKDAREKFLYSLFFFEPEKVINSCDFQTKAEREMPEENPEVTDEIRKISDNYGETLVRFEGLLTKKDQENIFIDVGDEVRKFPIDEDALLVNTWLDAVNDYEKVADEKISLDEINSGDDINLKMIKKTKKVVLVQKISVCS